MQFTLNMWAKEHCSVFNSVGNVTIEIIHNEHSYDFCILLYLYLTNSEDGVLHCSEQ